MTLTARCRQHLNVSASALLALALAFFSINAGAEGSRTVYPAGATGVRVALSAGYTSHAYARVAQNNQFFYVYAESGEYILLGSRNTNEGGDIRVYNPQSFGTRGMETVPATPDFSCQTQGGAGYIASRAQELAGPNSADASATVPNGFTPCVYQAPVAGIYGVRFTGKTSSGNPANSGSIDTPQALQNQVSAWDVTVRKTADSLQDIDGRLFTYAWVVRAGANGPSRRMYNDLYYISRDGYRYRQIFRGSDPNAAAFFANRSGFLDTNGAPLYRDMRGNNIPVNQGPSFAAGVEAARPDFPIFFSDVSPTGPNAAEVNRVLNALGIPQVPPVPQLTDPTFVGNATGHTSTESAGGVFTFDTVNTLTYEIVISRDGIDYDPASPLNRVLTGVANTGSHTVIWDGMDNMGDPFPVGEYEYRILGRNGEIHFPIIDLEGNEAGGPSLIKLNGSQDSTVYFDDRGYRTAGGTLIGELNGHLCGAGHLQIPPQPTHSLLGIDSNAEISAGKYYRHWPGSNDSNNDCVNSADEYFGTAKALDLWALEKTEQIINPIIIIPQQPGTVDVGTAVSVTPTVQTGDSVFGTFVFGNYGSDAANGVTYGVIIGNPADPSTCPASINFTALPASVTATYNGAPTCDVTFTGMPTTLAPSQTLSFNFTYVVDAGNAGPIPVHTEIDATNETPGAPAPNTADAQTTVLLPQVEANKASDPVTGSSVQLSDVIEYTVTVQVTGARLIGDVVLNDTLGTGLTFGSVTTAGAFTCTGALSCTLPAGTEPGTYTFSYTAQVNAQAVDLVGNQVTVSGGGGDTPPVCGTCATEHPVIVPVVEVNKSASPATGEPVTAGDTITYTLSAVVSDASLTQPLVLTDTLGAGLTFGAVSSAGDYMADVSAAPILVFTLPAGTPPGTYDVSYTVTVDNDASGTVANVVVPSGGGGDTPGCTVCATEHPVTDPAIVVSKSSAPVSGDTVAAGDTITYTLSAVVSDAALTQPLVLTDTLGAGLTFGAVSSAGDYVPDVSAAPTLVFSLPAGTAPGTYDVTYTATVDNDAAVSVGNNVVPSGGGNTPPDCTTCETLHPIADPAIAVNKSADPANGATVAAGDTITYTLSAVVSDAALTQPLVLIDTLGAGLTFGSVTSAGDYTADTSAAPALVFTLPAGATPGTYDVAYTATVDADASGSVGNSVVASGGGDTPPECTTCATEHPITDADIVVTKSSDPASGSTVAAGDTITYTLSAVVSDAALTQPLVLTDTLGNGLTFGAVSSAGDYTADTSAAPTLVFTLPAGTTPGTYDVTYTATVDDDATGTVGNSVVAEGGSDTPPVCTTCTTEHPLEASVTLLKQLVDEDGDEPGVAEPGEQFTYTITLTNSGGEDATAYAVSDQLDAHMVFVSADNGGSHAAGLVTWSGLTVPANDTLVLTVIVTVVDPIPYDVTEVRNLAWPTGTPPPACDDEHDGCVITPVAATPQIAVHKSVDVAQARPGDTVVYMISVQNIGTVGVTGLTVSDPLPAGIASFDWDCTGSAGATCPNANGSGALNELVPLLPVGGQLVYTIAAVVEDDASSVALNVVTVTPSDFARCADGSAAPCDANAGVELAFPPVEPVKIPATSPWALLLLMLGLGGLALRLGRPRLV